jgi:dolichol-phosphate mannosyltransferase
MHRFLPALASMTGARITEVPVSHFPRTYGESKYGFDRILKVLNDIFAMNLIIRFSSNPLMGFILCAIPFFLLSILFFGLAFSAIIFQWTSGKALFFMMSSALTGLAVVHLITLGVLGELVVNTSDLSHVHLPELTKKIIVLNGERGKDQEVSLLKPESRTERLIFKSTTNEPAKAKR